MPNRIVEWIKGAIFLAIGLVNLCRGVIDFWSVVADWVFTKTWHWQLFYEYLHLMRSQIPSLILPILEIPTVLVCLAIGGALVWQGLGLLASLPFDKLGVRM